MLIVNKYLFIGHEHRTNLGTN